MTTGEAASTLERLEQLDTLLRDVQAELAPAAGIPDPPLPLPPIPEPPPPPVPGEPPPPPVPEPPPPPPVPEEPPPPAPEPPPPPPAEPPPPPPIPEPALDASRQLEALTELAMRLLASIRELLAGYEQVVSQARATQARGIPSPAPASRPSRIRVETPRATMSAGPFPSIGALRAFEAAISRLPAVRDVAVLGYEGSDRAIIDVRLDHESP